MFKHLIEEFKTIKSTTKDLRSFAIVMFVAFAAMEGVGYWKEWGSFPYLAGISGLFLILGFVFPKALLPLQKLWMGFALVLGFIMAPVVLTILFYLTITPISLLGRMVGKEFLELKLDPSKKSYWHFREDKEIERGSYEKQF